MVDIVANFAASLFTDTSEAALAKQNVTFTKSEQYHPLCWIDYGSQESIEKCWMGNSAVALMNLNTENAQVQDTLNKMIKEFVVTYQIDGLRIDGKERYLSSLTLRAHHACWIISCQTRSQGLLDQILWFSRCFLHGRSLLRRHSVSPTQCDPPSSGRYLI